MISIYCRIQMHHPPPDSYLLRRLQLLLPLLRVFKLWMLSLVLYQALEDFQDQVLLFCLHIRFCLTRKIFGFYCSWSLCSSQSNIGNCCSNADYRSRFDITCPCCSCCCSLQFSNTSSRVGHPSTWCASFTSATISGLTSSVNKYVILVLQIKSWLIEEAWRIKESDKKQVSTQLLYHPLPW